MVASSNLITVGMHAVNCISYLFFRRHFLPKATTSTLYTGTTGSVTVRETALQFIQLPYQSWNLRPLGHIGSNQKSFFLEPFSLIFCIKSNAKSNTFWDIKLYSILFGEGFFVLFCFFGCIYLIKKYSKTSNILNIITILLWLYLKMQFISVVAKLHFQ